MRSTLGFWAARLLKLALLALPFVVFFIALSIFTMMVFPRMPLAWKVIPTLCLAWLVADKAISRN